MRNPLNFDSNVTPRPDLPWTPPLPVIGLLGGVASGKSLVAQRLLEHGAGLLDGDRAGHAVLCLPEVELAARQRWGDTIFTPDGRISRPAVAKIVFAPPPEGPPELHYLEQLTHPLIGQELRRQAASMASSGNHAALVMDAPVMLKSGWNKFCNQIWFVDAPPHVRLARALARGWSAESFIRREESQEPLEVKRSHADIVIDNSGSRDETHQQIDRHWQTFLQQHVRQ
ncbi:MAG: dephospho-CoA kinase [Pirellulales bacterium]